MPKFTFPTEWPLHSSLLNPGPVPESLQAQMQIFRVWGRCNHTSWSDPAQPGLICQVLPPEFSSWTSTVAGDASSPVPCLIRMCQHAQLYFSCANFKARISEWGVLSNEFQNTLWWQNSQCKSCAWTLHWLPTTNNRLFVLIKFTVTKISGDNSRLASHSA